MSIETCEYDSSELAQTCPKKMKSKRESMNHSITRLSSLASADAKSRSRKFEDCGKRQGYEVML